MASTSKTLSAKIRLRKDTRINWETPTGGNIVLLDGEIAIVVNNDNSVDFKIGNGITNFSSLPYLTFNDIKSKNITVNDTPVALAAPNPTNGNLAALDINGNPVDSGWSADNLARYSLETLSISNNNITLIDRSCNYLDARTLGSSDTINLDFPIVVNNKARDFIFAIECGSNPPTISYAAFTTIMSEDASSLIPEEGMNIYSFTEFKQNMFIAARKLINTVVVNIPENVDQLLLAMQKRGIDTTNITDFDGVITALNLNDSDTPQDAIDAVIN